MARKDSKLQLDALEVLQQHDHELTGARLVLAKSDTAYFIAWVAPWQKTVKDFIRFDALDLAEEAFTAKAANKPPRTSALTRDFQVSAVYAWEEKYIHPSAMNIKPEQMERVIKRVAQDFNIDKPSLKYSKPHAHRGYIVSSYMPDNHAIEMQHRKLSYVLHEAAHAIDTRAGNEWTDHGPSFVRILIRLADKYQFWHSAEELEQSAKDAGILVAPDHAVPKLPASPKP